MPLFQTFFEIGIGLSFGFCIGLFPIAVYKKITSR